METADGRRRPAGLDMTHLMAVWSAAGLEQFLLAPSRGHRSAARTLEAHVSMRLFGDHRFLLTFLVCGICAFLSVASPVHAQGITFPAVGLFNANLNQRNITECDNGNEEPVNLRLVLRNRRNEHLAALSFTLSAFGSRHVILNDLANIAHEYGTYLIELQSAAELGRRVTCRTAFYLDAPAGSPKPFQFAYALPVRDPLQGTVGGTFNSYNASNLPDPTWNWLTLANVSDENFDAILELWDVDGSLISSGTLPTLAPGERRDFALGHTEGQRVGVYLIRPANATQKYEAFVIRYSPNGGRFDFAFPLRALAGACNGEPVQISTMGNGLTQNWLEIANLSAQTVRASIALRNRPGQTIHSEPATIAGYAQKHLYVNQHLDPQHRGDVGSASVTCDDPTAQLVVQSVYYGHVPGSSAVEWAYGVQAGIGGTADVNEQLSMPLNTYVGMANWYKAANLATEPVTVDYTVLDLRGNAVAASSRSIGAAGTADVAAHEMSGYSFAGTLISTTSAGRLAGEVLRVLPRIDGHIGYIMQIPAVSQPKATLPTPPSGFFPPGAVWYQDISQAPLDPQSSAVISWLNSQGGWGGGRMQIDFSIEVLHAAPDTPFRSFERTGDFFEPDCDFEPIPVPAGGAIEGEEGYQCVSDGDCHLIVAHRASGKLFEMWRANIVGNSFQGGCLAVWDMNRVYGPSGRGENCTSADAAGYPIAPLLFTADEVAAGSINHAIRFILPNARIRRGVYLHPATHSTGAASGGTNAPPYGTRLRLRADYPLETLPNDAARVVARAMQRYGILLSDGGTIALTAQSDRFTTAKWDGLLAPRDLQALRVTDFEMVAGGDRIPYTGDCVRNP